MEEAGAEEGMPVGLRRGGGLQLRQPIRFHAEPYTSVAWHSKNGVGRPVGPGWFMHGGPLGGARGERAGTAALKAQ